MLLMEMPYSDWTIGLVRCIDKHLSASEMEENPMALVNPPKGRGE